MTETADYFQFVRREIEPLLGPAPKRILEVGCGAGRTLAWLKSKWPDAETVGVDGSTDVADELAKNADRALIHDLETPLPDLGHFDLILALDVLEHLRRPDDVLQQLTGHLADGGAVIVSVPNIANYQVLLPLVFKRRFRYEDSGLLDRTHLRFFTEDSTVALIEDAGLSVTRGVMTGFSSGRSRWIDRLSLGGLRHYVTVQYIVRAERGPARRFAWTRY